VRIARVKRQAAEIVTDPAKAGIQPKGLTIEDPGVLDVSFFLQHPCEAVPEAGVGRVMGDEVREQGDGLRLAAL
jgi:hypothetical protein